MFLEALLPLSQQMYVRYTQQARQHRLGSQGFHEWLSARSSFAEEIATRHTQRDIGRLGEEVEEHPPLGEIRSIEHVGRESSGATSATLSATVRTAVQVAPSRPYESKLVARPDKRTGDGKEVSSDHTPSLHHSISSSHRDLEPSTGRVAADYLVSDGRFEVNVSGASTRSGVQTRNRGRDAGGVGDVSTPSQRVVVQALSPEMPSMPRASSDHLQVDKPKGLAVTDTTPGAAHSSLNYIDVEVGRAVLQTRHSSTDARLLETLGTSGSHAERAISSAAAGELSGAGAEYQATARPLDVRNPFSADPTNLPTTDASAAPVPFKSRREGTRADFAIQAKEYDSRGSAAPMVHTVRVAVAPLTHSLGDMPLLLTPSVSPVQASPVFRQSGSSEGVGGRLASTNSDGALSGLLDEVSPIAPPSIRSGTSDSSEDPDRMVRRVLREIAIEAERRGGTQWR